MQRTRAKAENSSIYNTLVGAGHLNHVLQTTCAARAHVLVVRISNVFNLHSYVKEGRYLIDVNTIALPELTQSANTMEVQRH